MSMPVQDEYAVPDGNPNYWGYEDLNYIVILFGLTEIAISILSIILFIQWFRRGYHNLHKVGGKNLSATEGWAAGAWFVPFLNLVRPYEIMKEIWIGSQQFYTTDKKEREEIIASKSMVDKWWTLFIIERIVSYASAKFESYTFDIATSLIGIIALYITIQMVKKSAIHQELLFSYQRVKNFGTEEADQNFEAKN